MPIRGGNRRESQSRSFLEPVLTVISANVEGFSTAKHAKQLVLAELCSNLQCDILCLQETHRGSDNHRPVIPGMVLVLTERPHRQYGSAVFVKAGSDIVPTSQSDTNNIEVLTVELTSVVVTSVYKLPTVDFNFPATHVPLKHDKPQIILEDINSHSTQWGCKDNNRDGISVEEWIDSNEVSLIHDPKLPTSFQSARWKRDYNPDLAIVSNDISNLCKKIVLNLL